MPCVQLEFNFVLSFPKLRVIEEPIRFVFGQKDLKDGFEKIIRNYCLYACHIDSCRGCSLGEFRLSVSRMAAKDLYDLWTAKAVVLAYTDRQLRVSEQFIELLEDQGIKPFFLVHNVKAFIMELENARDRLQRESDAGAEGPADEAGAEEGSDVHTE